MAKKSNQDDILVDVDELYSKSEQFVDKNRKQLTLGLGGAAAVILLVIGYTSLVVAPKNMAAEEAAFMAEHYFAKDSADLAMLGDGLNAGLEEILNDHSGTPAAARAAFELGIMHRDAARFDEAVEAFNQAGFSDDVFGPLVDANIGDCLVELGDLEGAESHFASAASSHLLGNEAWEKYREASEEISFKKTVRVKELPHQLRREQLDCKDLRSASFRALCPSNFEDNSLQQATFKNNKLVAHRMVSDGYALLD